MVVKKLGDLEEYEFGVELGEEIDDDGGALAVLSRVEAETGIGTGAGAFGLLLGFTFSSVPTVKFCNAFDADCTVCDSSSLEHSVWT